MKKQSVKALLMMFAAFFMIFGITGQAAASGGKGKKAFLNVAHRGVSGLAPEHTLAAYDLVKENKGDYIEIDLQMTKDGHLIAMHDTTVNRTTDGTGKVKDKTLAEIKKLDAGSWFNETYPQYAKPEYESLTVPTLEEIFQRYGKKANYYIETKSPDVYPGMEEKLIALLDKYKLSANKPANQVLIQSFSKESLLIVKELRPNLPLVQLLSYAIDSSGNVYEKTGLTSAPGEVTRKEWQEIASYAVGVGPNYRSGGQLILQERFVKGAQANKLAVHPYTVNTAEDMELLLGWGVNGMFTNFPGTLHDVHKAFQKKHDKKGPKHGHK